MAELKLVVGADVKQAEQALKVFGSSLDKTTASIQRFSADVNRSFGALPLHNIDQFRKVFLQFKSDLSNVKISPIDVTPAQQALRDLVQEVQKTSVSVTNVAPAFQKAGADINKSFGTLPLGSINAFRSALLDFKTDLSSIKVSAIPPISVDISPAQQALRILTEEAQKSGTSVSNVAAAYARWSAQVASSAETATNSLKQVNTTIANVQSTSQRSFGAIGANADQASAAIQKFSTEINRSIGTTPLHNVNAFRQAFIALKTDLASVKIAAIPPVDLNIEPAKQALQSLTADSKRSGILIAQSFGKIPLDGIVNFQKAFFEFKKDLGNVKIAAIPPITIDTTPAETALKTLVANAGSAAGSVKGFSADINRSFGLIKVAAIPPVTADISQAQQAFKTLAAEAQKTGVSVGTISSSIDRFSANVIKSVGALPLHNIETFRQAFQNLKADLTNVKIAAIPPIRVDTEQAKQALRSLTDESQKTGISVGNVSAAFVKLSGQIAGSGGSAVNAMQGVSDSVNKAQIAAKGSFTSIIASIEAATASAERFGLDINRSLGSLSTQNITAFRQAFLQFKADLSNVKIAAIPPINADIRPAQQALRILTEEAQRAGAAVTSIAPSIQRFSGTVTQSLSGLKFNIETFHQSFQKLKSDLSSVKISAIPPVTVNTEQAQQALKTLTTEAERSGAQVGNVSTAYKIFATQVASSGAVAAKSLSEVNEGISRVEATSKRSFGAVVTSLNQSGVSVQRFGAEVNRSLGTLPLHNITAFRQAFLDFKADLSNVKFAAIPPITADIRPAQQALKTLTSEVEKSGVAATKVSTVYSKWAGEVAESSGTAVGALDKVNDGATKVESTYKKSFTSIGASIGKIPTSVRPALAAVSKLGDTVETLRAKLLARQSFLVTEKDVGRIAILNSEIRELQAEIQRVKNIGSAGFDSLGNAVTKTGGSFNALSVGAKKGFSALRTLAHIIPGIGIAGLIGVVTNAVAGLFSMGKAAEETTQKLKELIIPLSDIRDAAIGGTQDELSRVTALSNAILDQNKSYTQRNAALLQLKKINESYFGDLTLEAAKLGLLKTAVDEYTKAIINAAIIKAFEGEIGKVNLELVKQEKAFNEFGKKVTDAKEKLLKSKGDDFFFQNIKVQDATADFNKQAKVVGQLRGQMFELRTAIQAAVDASLDFKPLEIDKPKGTKDAEEDLQKFINRAKQLAAELEKIGFIAPAEFSFFDTFQEQITKAKKVFDDFNKGELKLQQRIINFPSFSEPEIKEKVDRALDVVREGIRSGIIGLPSIPIGVNVEFSEVTNFSQNTDLIREFKDRFKNLSKILPDIDMEMAAGFNRGLFIDALRKYFKAGSTVAEQEILKFADQTEKNLVDLAGAINTAISNITVGGFTGIGEAIGEALAGGGVADAFKAFAGVVADAVSAIGKQFITLGVTALLAKKALTKLFTQPALAIAAGVALVTVAAALRSSLNKGVTGFAEGGLVFGPTVGLVGEGIGTSRSNPEVIAPLDQLKKMLGDVGPGSLQVVVVGRLRGKDQILQNARTNKSQRRLG